MVAYLPDLIRIFLLKGRFQQFNHIVFGYQIILRSILLAGLFQGVIGIIGQVCIMGHTVVTERLVSICLASLATWVDC